MSGGGTPRQQMIGLMYLVLLAMLAMNASKDLLNAFVMLENGIDKTVKNFSEKNLKYYDVIDAAAAKIESAKVKQKMANEIKAKADELVEIIATDKKWLVKNSGGRAPDSIPYGKDNQDLGAQYYIVNDGGGNGDRLKTKINEYRELILKTLDNDGIEENDYLIEEYKTILSTDDKADPHDPGIKMDFANQISAHLPLASVTANLSLWQSYVRNAEADVVGGLAATLEGKGITVNTVEGMAAFESGYVLKGDTIKSNIFISAYNSNITPVVYIGIVDSNKMKAGHWLDGTAKAAPPIIGTATPVNVKAGKGRFMLPATEVGGGVLQGVIGIPSTKGIDYFPFKQNYMVAEPTATVAASKMNVLYVGVDNPMQVSAPGVSTDEIEISGPGISFRPDPTTPGGYIARASAANPRGTDLTVKKKSDNTVLATTSFRVKRLPDPVATILGQKEGLVSKGKLKAASFLKAEMENFDFEAPVRVVSFKMTVSMGGDLQELSSNDATLSAPMKNLLGNVRTGNRVYFEEIKVKMPDGSVRKVPSIILKVQ